jgi:hypothetical protein
VTSKRTKKNQSNNKCLHGDEHGKRGEYVDQPDGSLNEIASVSIPYSSPQGLAGF